MWSRAPAWVKPEYLARLPFRSLKDGFRSHGDEPEASTTHSLSALISNNVGLSRAGNELNSATSASSLAPSRVRGPGKPIAADKMSNGVHERVHEHPPHECARVRPKRKGGGGERSCSSRPCPDESMMPNCVVVVVVVVVCVCVYA